MRKFFVLAYLLFGLLFKSIGKDAALPVAVITGKMNEYKAGEMVLLKTEGGMRIKYATYQKKKDNQFAFAVT